MNHITTSGNVRSTTIVCRYLMRAAHSLSVPIAVSVTRDRVIVHLRNPEIERILLTGGGKLPS